MPNASVHREIERAERAGIVESRRIGRTRLVRAATESPYFEPLRELLVRSFGAPRVLADALASVSGIERAFIFGSWAARWHGEVGLRPVGDIDVLVLGEPDRTLLYEQSANASRRLGIEVQTTIRDTRWMDDGEGPFHATVTSRPLLQVC